jgi:hypothetical protein
MHSNSGDIVGSGSIPMDTLAGNVNANSQQLFNTDELSEFAHNLRHTHYGVPDPTTVESPPQRKKKIVVKRVGFHSCAVFSCVFHFILCVVSLALISVGFSCWTDDTMVFPGCNEFKWVLVLCGLGTVAIQFIAAITVVCKLAIDSQIKELRTF